MFLSALFIVVGIVFLAGVGRLIWQIVRGPDAQRRKALATLLTNRGIAAGESSSRSARERRMLKHAAWSQRQHQHTHSQAQHATFHHGSLSSSHSTPPSGHHSSSHHGGFGSSGHSGGHQ